MIEKIIDLLGTPDPVNWELAIQLSEGAGLCEKIYPKIRISSKLEERFLKLPIKGEVIKGQYDIDSLTIHAQRIEKCGMKLDLMFVQLDGMFFNAKAESYCDDTHTFKGKTLKHYFDFCLYFLGETENGECLFDNHFYSAIDLLA